MTIAKRLMLLILIAIGALLAVGAGGILGMKKGQSNLSFVNQNVLPSIDLLDHVSEKQKDLLTKMRKHIGSYEAQEMADMEKLIKADIASIKQMFGEYKKLVSDGADQKDLDADEAAFAAYEKALTQSMAMSHDNQKTVAENILSDNAAVIAKVSEVLGEHKKYNFKIADAAAEASQKTYSTIFATVVGLILVAVLVVGTIGRFIYKSVVTSLSELRNTLTHIERNLDFTMRTNVSSNDEVGMTIEAVNRLTIRLQESLREIAEQSDRVTEAARHLTETAHTVTESASSQSAAAADMAATVEQMTVSINHVADQAGEANSLSSESGTLAIDGEKTIVETVEDINLIATTVQAASEFVANLDRDSQRVNEVIGVIKEIADQTNLLALNAAIEAARAGEQGRGFAVVADEVRKLAERTSQSTQVIAETIAAMQVNASNTVEGMKAVGERVTLGVERANAANSAIAQIRSSSGRAVERVGEISNAIREQGIASTNIAQQVEKIAQMSEENHAAAENTSSTAEELDQLAHRMKDIVSQYRI
ncbi:MAG TPA: methyl-accepting chemotaxis protein [Rhodocyclaceae bacterium]|nr:methyl-accepting chemotaxis protein [Rhodocyclaceae bacterium]